MSTCPKCGKAIPATIRYCAYCGATVPRRPAQWLARVDWPFLGRWLAAAALSGTLASLLLTHQYVSRLLAGVGTFATPLAALLAGLVVGAAQLPVMAGRRGWAVALPVGWGLAFALWTAWPQLGRACPWLQPAGAMVVPLAVLGGLAGAIQWPLARHYAWPASRWALVSALAAPAAAVAVALALPTEKPGGWFMQIALRTGGRPLFATTDLAVAGLVGLALGAGQYPLIRRAVGLAPIWPLASAAGLLCGALALDGIFAGAQAAAMSFGSPGILVYWYQFAGGPGGAAVAWGLLGTGLGAGQAGFLGLAAALPPALAGRGPAAGGQPERPGRLWVPATVAGAATGALVAWPLIAGGWLLLAAAGAGLLVGLPQWWAAGPRFKAAAWLPATAAGGWCLLVVVAQLAQAGHQPAVAQAALSLPAILTVLTLLPGGILAVRQ